MSKKQDNDTIDIARSCAQEKHGEDIVVFSPGELSSVADHFMIVTADSEPQVRAISSFIERELRKRLSIRVSNIPDESSSGWVILDYGNVIINIMLRETRARYGLDHLLNTMVGMIGGTK